MTAPCDCVNIAKDINPSIFAAMFPDSNIPAFFSTLCKDD